jgi:predicted membrane-bound spermidine synthase
MSNGRAWGPFAATLCLVFVASGAASLAFETLWLHQARLALGNDVWASSLTLSAFMAGMAVGNGLCARIGDRVRNPARAYAALEVVVAVSGLGLVYLLPELSAWLAPAAGALLDQPALLQALRLVLAFALMVVPSAAMGATLPLLVRALAARDRSYGRALGLLYGSNTLGAVLGVIATESTLLAARGVRGTALIAALLSLLAAGIAWLLGGAAADAAPLPTADEPQPAPPALPTRLLGAAFAAGFLLLALEVVWMRLLVLFLNDTPIAFAVVLAVVLFGIALGGLVASVWAGRSARAAEHAGLVAFAAGALGVLGYRVYPWALQTFFEVEQSAATIAQVAAPVVLPTAIASGALFTLLGAGLRKAGPAAAAATGRLALANTFGAALGPLIAGFVLLPGLGMEWALWLLLLGYGVIGLVLADRRWLGLTVRVAAVSAFVLAFALFPYGSARKILVRSSVGRWMTADDVLVSVREGQLATLAHVRHGMNGLPLFDQLATNAYSMTVNDFAGRRYMELFVALPAAVHQRIRRALVIGYGIGNTTRALTALPEVERVDVVDISSDIIELARAITPPHAKHPLSDPRVHVRIDDGRFFLDATRARYDLITGEPPPPVMAGMASLYSREYFARMRARLNEGGFASYWLPMMNISAGTGRSIIAAFCSAFEDCSLWHGSARNFMLLGSRNARGGVTDVRFTAQWNDPSNLNELRSIGLELPGQLGSLFIGDAPYLRALTEADPPVADDWPRRLQRPGTFAQRDELIWQWRDTRAARDRFTTSSLITSLWPAVMRRDALRNFENQRLINDLLFPEQTPARQVQVLDAVLHGTPLELPILLLLNSDPDIQAALARAGAARADRPEWALHRTAGYLADRTFVAAEKSLRAVPDAALPMAGLREYVARMAKEEPVLEMPEPVWPK